MTIVLRSHDYNPSYSHDYSDFWYGISDYVDRAVSHLQRYHPIAKTSKGFLLLNKQSMIYHSFD